MAKLLMALGTAMAAWAAPAQACSVPLVEKQSWPRQRSFARDEIKGADLIIVGKVIKIDDDSGPAIVKVERVLRAPTTAFVLVTRRLCGGHSLGIVGERRVLTLYRWADTDTALRRPPASADIARLYTLSYVGFAYDRAIRHVLRRMRLLER